MKTSHIRVYQRFWQMFYKTKNKNKKYFCTSYLQCFSSKNVLMQDKKICLSINSAQSVRFEKGTSKFKNHFKQIPVLFKVYANFEYNLEGVEVYEDCYSKKYQDHASCGFAYKPVWVDDKFTQTIVVFRGENVAYECIKAILKKYQYCKKVINKYFNKNLTMVEEEERQFQSSNTCWLCEKPIEKVTNRCHITRKKNIKLLKKFL